MKDKLKKLIEFETVSNDKDKNRDALEWVEKQIKGYETQFKTYNGHPVLIVGSRNPKVCLQAHIDVVPGKKEDFKPKVKNGKLFGRGVYDMKFAIACYLEVLKEVKSDKLGLLLTSDEEIGGFNGVGAVLEDGYDPNFCFLPDGGDSWSYDEKIKGVWHLEVSSSGVAGHASRPWEGDSAISKLISFLTELENEFEDEVYESECFESSMNIGKIEGGLATNQIADDAKAKVDIRFTNEKEKSEIEEKIDDLVDSYEGVEVDEEVFGASFSCDTQSEYCKTFTKLAKKKKKNVSSQIAHGSSDARFFAQKNIPTIMIKPKGGGSHSKSEWIDLKDLNDYCQVLTEFVEQIL